jgi:hypothetical protein
MRLSSIVSLVVVSASLALGGCAADAEDGDTKSPNVALSDKTRVQEPDNSRLEDTRQLGTIAEQYANPTDETKARLVEKYGSGTSNPRIEIQPSGFGAVPSEKLGAVPITFQPVNQLEQAIELEPGYLPYSHIPKP